ncbi:class A sortase [Enterococcus faecalis]|uniref:class A sortase n=1 Tax=Enterococcus faecalis TaxID=1351 RepID=UPI000CF03A92|nr:class A sortase [Enterococcus faecalis]EGO2582187.1 class A sortase [Enterococcus faecalis]EGO2659103.1 class A sortase [Enterococcus faecalis]EGO2741124.1 class A sortase [Enterococcus faecalis]EGO2831070.1 class A sortase [Enterococcus faecalis]EGO5112115.1 class A sortase [Enterococcus faecalis]
MKTWLKKNKYLVGSIGFGMIALFCFFFATLNQKEEFTREAKTLLSSGLEEAKKPKKQVETKTSETNSFQPEVVTDAEIPVEPEETALPTGVALSEGERPTVETLQEAQKDFEQVKDDILGTIRIASIGLEMPILEGDSFEKMLYGACTVLPKQTMGKGNYTLAAHNAGVDGLMFSSLGNVAVGEIITLQDRSGHVYNYKVKEQRHVNMTDTSILNLTRKPTLTLITCDQATKTDGRIVVIAELD